MATIRNLELAEARQVNKVLAYFKQSGGFIPNISTRLRTMSLFLTILIGASLLGLAILSISYALNTKEWVKFAIHSFALVAFGIILNVTLGFPFVQNTPPTKGPEQNNEIYFIGALYFFMLVGMLSQHLYDHLSKPKRKRGKFDVGMFVAPIFGSPVVFIPLFAALQNAEVDLSGFSTPSIMVFLVAFENGFFWKELINQRLNKKRNETVLD